MKRLSIFVLTLIFTLSGSLAASAKMSFQSKEIDFGEIDSGKVLDLEFKFVNSGDETLLIKNIHSSCGCTVTRVEKKEYAPGERGVIPVKFFSRGNDGQILKSIAIETNDADNPNTVLKIKGTVHLKDFPMAQPDPEQVDFEKVQKGKQYSRILKIKNTGTADLMINEVTHRPEVYLVFDKTVVEPGKHAEIKIMFTPRQAERFSTFMRIRTNGHKQSTQIIKVFADVE